MVPVIMVCPKLICFQGSGKGTVTVSLVDRGIGEEGTVSPCEGLWGTLRCHGQECNIIQCLQTLGCLSRASPRAFAAAYSEGLGGPVPREGLGSERWWHSWCLSPQGRLKTDHRLLASISASPEMDRQMDSSLK